VSFLEHVKCTSDKILFSSPISLSIATLILFLWRPIMEELADALPIGGGPYTYL